MTLTDGTYELVPESKSEQCEAQVNLTEVAEYQVDRSIAECIRNVEAALQPLALRDQAHPHQHLIVTLMTSLENSVTHRYLTC
jgi:hypothetical protein